MGRVLTTGVAAFFVVYVLLQKKWLPKVLWKPLARFYFYPMLLPAYLWRSLVVGGNYFTDVDGSLLLGAVPLQIMVRARSQKSLLPSPRRRRKQPAHTPARATALPTNRRWADR